MPEPERTSQPPPDEPFPRFTALRFKTAAYAITVPPIISVAVQIRAGAAHEEAKGRTRLTSSEDDDLTQNTTFHIVGLSLSHLRCVYFSSRATNETREKDRFVHVAEYDVIRDSQEQFYCKHVTYKVHVSPQDDSNYANCPVADL